MTIVVSLHTIPADLHRVPNWVCWRYEERNGKLTKVPKNPNTGANADVTDPSTWTDFETALRAYEWFGWDGIGLVLTDQLGLVAWDFDHCRAEDGSWREEVLQLVRQLDSYTEVTPSGEGLRVLCWGSIPRNRKEQARGIEVYQDRRFMTITGNHMEGTPTTIEHRQEAIEAVFARVFGEPKTDASAPAPAPADLNDEELLQRAFRAENGAKFRALWHGDSTGYPSESEADLALMSMLLFWTGGDTARAERLFSQSPRGQREKWRTRADYRQMTLQRALQGKTEFYEPNRHNGHAPEVMTKFVPRRFTEKILERHLFRSWGDLTRGDFYRYDADAGVWREDAEAFLAHLLRDGELLPEEWKKEHYINEIIADVRALVWRPDPLPEPPLHLIPFANGVYDLHTGTLRPYRPEDGFRSKLRWCYDPNAQSTLLVHRLGALPEQIRQHFWELLAYCLWRGYPLQRAFFWLGTRGSNGKSYLTKLLLRAIGEENVAQVSLHDLAENRFAVAQLHGKWLNLSGELSYDDLKRTDTFKALCGGDLISADRKFREPVLFRNHAKLLFVGNSLPVSADTTDAFYRRAFVVRFEHQFREDPRIETELDTLAPEDAECEFSWLMTRAVGELRRLLENGFQLTGDLPVEEKRRQYMALSNPLRQFVEECCETTRRTEDFIYKYEFAEQFMQWLQERGLNTYSETRLGREMRALGFEDGQRGEKKWRAWLGLRWSSHIVHRVHTHFETDSENAYTQLQKPCEPCEPCDEAAEVRVRATPLGVACRAIGEALRDGREATKEELRRATRLPPRVLQEVLQHLLETGELESTAGRYQLVEVTDDG